MLLLTAMITKTKQFTSDRKTKQKQQQQNNNNNED